MSAMITAMLGIVLHLAPATPAHHQAECPTPDSEAQSRVTSFLSLPQLADLRQVADLGSASSSNVRVLADDMDRATCGALRRAVASSGRQATSGDRLAFFRSGDRYFVPITPPRPTDRVRLGEYSVIEVYDAQYRFIARFSA